MKDRKEKAYNNNLEKYKEDKRKEMKKERGIALVNIIIIILLILILFTLMALVVSKNNEENNGQNISNKNPIVDNRTNQNTVQTGINSTMGTNTNNPLTGDTNTNDPLTGNTNTNDSLTGNTNTNDSLTGNTNVGITTGNYKIGDTINLEADNMLIRIDSVDIIKNNDGTEMARAQVTFKNINKIDYGNLTPLYYIIHPVFSLGSVDITYYLDTSNTYKDNLLNQKVKSGETITAYLYWKNNSDINRIKITPIVDVIDAEENDYKYGDAHYIMLE